MTVEVLVVSAFRRPDFRHAVSPSHPFEEPWDSPPFTAAAACEAAGYETAVLALQNIYTGFDEASDIESLTALLRQYRQARLLLFCSDNFIASRSTATTYGIGIVSALARTSNPAIKIGVCGRLATTARIELLHAVPEVDFLIVGEFDGVLGTAVARALTDHARLDDLPFVLTRRTIGRTESIEPAFVDNPDALPLPAFHLAGPSIEQLMRRRAFPGSTVPFSIRTSFGCKFRCRFCAGVPHWNDYRTKSRPRIAAEVDHLYESLRDHARLSFLEDEIATRHLDHVEALAAVLSERHIRLDGLYTHSSLLTPEVATLLAPVVDRVFLGLDSPEDSILRHMGKGQRLDTVLAAVDRARTAGLGVHLEWILGSPQETVNSLITSLNAMFMLIATDVVTSINTYVYCPHPGTEYAENAENFGMTIHERFEMLESGGYPASSTSQLSRQQVFTAYLMSQLIITEAESARRNGGKVAGTPKPAVRHELQRIFTQVGGES